MIMIIQFHSDQNHDVVILMINIVQIGWVHTWYAGWLGYDGASCHAAGTLYFPNLHCSQNFFSSGIIVGNFLQIGLAAIFIFCNWFITGRLRIDSYRTPHIFFSKSFWPYVFYLEKALSYCEFCCCSHIWLVCYSIMMDYTL